MGNKKNEDSSNTNSKEKIKSILFIIWFITSLILMCSLGSINGMYSLITLGQYFLVFGIISFGANKIAATSFSIIGSGLIIFPILNLINLKINWSILAPSLMFIGSIIIGLTLVLATLLEEKKRKKLCTVPVEAIVTHYTYIYSKSEYGRRKSYSPIYKYQYNNEIYESVYPFFSNVKSLINTDKNVTININPNNPTEIFVRSKVTKFIIMIGIINTVVFTLTFIYYLIKSLWFEINIRVQFKVNSFYYIKILK